MDLGRVLAYLHDIGQEYPKTAPRLHQVSGWIVEHTIDVADDEVACRGCGGPVVQSGRGRRREWCGDACRKRTTRRQTRNVSGVGPD